MSYDAISIIACFFQGQIKMPLYNILCVAAHYPEIAPIRELLKTTTQIINNGGGLIKNVDYWGTQTLPNKMIRHQQIYDKGDYIHMSFLASPPLLKNVNNLLKLDPRVIRWQTTKEKM
ncbi:hypothetical protein E3Q23_03983 [Wallemia mellicola]|uniref:Ribosomal protein S6 n=2 Tax=Wallemia mellicola TaxID=1708541 RepID=A0A4T0LMV9_9BASI|nr:hypothetical protein E3Q23_03983 [Wallemia mellicola]TIC07935.1 hypothetical protein E3Q14_04128 [Wallemia mellicola]TIC24483.1 hypothetical protein E3Q10_04044 [Wallemia mellicola]TIC62305.1 hypothetical protein E3Q01_04026 [Wallemia mellicola]TIC72558.1 hypothetical protein E3Q00_03853 [Wallemia mellicola]